MGDFMSKMIRRAFDYPIKRPPICFYRPEDFTTTGEAIGKEDRLDMGTYGGPENVVSTYEAFFDLFHNRLIGMRKKNRMLKEQNTRWSIQLLMQKYPGWNEITVANLHSLFLLFNNDANGMLGADNFCSVLECLGDDNSHEVRISKFEEADKDKDGWINYDVFLSTIYNFNPPSKGGPRGIGKLCYDIGEKIQFITTLSVGEQLEYGLF